MGQEVTEAELMAHYELALKIISETSPNGDTLDDFKIWLGCIRLLANNALLQNSLNCEFEEALKTSARQKANAGRTLRIK